MERGNRTQRHLDFWAGIPLVVLAGSVNGIRRIAMPSVDVGKSRRVGVICLGAIGDLLLASSLLDGLRQALPESIIEVVSSKANAAVRDLLPRDFRMVSFGIRDITGMVRHVRSARYDILFDVGQWPRISALIAAVSGAGKTVGFATPGQYRHYAYDVAVPHCNERHEVENFLALGRALFPDLTGKPCIVVPDAPSSGCPSLPESNFVFCHMWPSGLLSYLKEWRQDSWAELARTLLNAGYVPVFTGGAQDAAATDAFVKKYGLGPEYGGLHAFSVAGKMAFPDMAFHLRRAAAVVSVNTGTMHLAAICGAPTVGLHGPTNPLRWGPVGQATISLLPQKGICGYLNLGFEYPPNAEAVLQHMSVREILLALRSLGLCV